MKRLKLLFIVLLFIPMLVMGTGCKKSRTPVNSTPSTENSTESGNENNNSNNNENNNTTPPDITDGIISTAEELLLLQTGDWSGDYELSANIDLGGVEWKPIGGNGQDNPFTGSFDGKGFKISNFKITKFWQYCGFFGMLKNAEIKNLGIVDFVIDCDEKQGTYGYTTSEPISYYGGLCGYAESRDEEDMRFISNCYSTNGSIIAERRSTYSHYSGGLIGHSRDISIKNCYSNCDVKGYSCAKSYNGTYIGGLIGKAYRYHHDEILVDSCYATGNVEGIGHCESMVGGLMGVSSSGLKITNCYATGNVYSQQNEPSMCSSDAGGLIGHVYDIYMRFCYATGDVNSIGKNDAQAGGLLGYVGGDGEICDSYSTGHLVADNDLYGSVGNITGAEVYYKNITITNCYSSCTSNKEGYNSTSNQDIWEIIMTTWDSNKWNLTNNSHPTLKN